jgi:2-polyprenyl-3-methyl-5-hydroxy-6-metoxy-1,4-benzoquinol methylase
VTSQPQQPEDHILRSWRANAGPWSQAIAEQRIESRRLVTDRAIVDAVTARNPRTVLDIGCGEGWLARALAERGIAVTGVDAIEELVQRARALGPGEYHVATYDDIAAGRFSARVDLAVANFALIGAESVDRLAAAVPRLLAPGGAFVIQTLHPMVMAGDAPYKEGWRDGAWSIANLDFTDPAPWYFRPLEAWVRLLTAAGFRLAELREPLNPQTGKPASLILVGTI